MKKFKKIIKQNNITKQVKNNDGNTYEWVKINKRWFCKDTKHRVDPDGYRLITKNKKLILVDAKHTWYYRKRKKKK